MLPGHVESMMKKSGCYIRYELNLDDQKINNFAPNPITPINSTKSLGDCAHSCFNNSQCVDGWSFQITTGKCLTFKTANTTLLKPASMMAPKQESIGWISGTEMCDQQNDADTSCKKEGGVYLTI